MCVLKDEYVRMRVDIYIQCLSSDTVQSHACKAQVPSLQGSPLAPVTLLLLVSLHQQHSV